MHLLDKARPLSADRTKTLQAFIKRSSGQSCLLSSFQAMQPGSNAVHKICNQSTAQAKLTIFHKRICYGYNIIGIAGTVPA
jgi:hypothetical protein